MSKSVNSRKPCIEILSSPGQFEDNQFAYTWEVILVGDYGVGKSNFISRFGHDEFHPEIKPTMQPEPAVCAIKINGKLIKVMIWDPCGLERFGQNKLKEYYRKATGAILLYDITDQSSFTNAKKWLDELQRAAGKNVVVTLIGNKSDQRHNRKVTKNDAKTFVEERKLTSFLEASTLDATNIKLAFEKTFSEIYKLQLNNLQSTTKMTEGKKGNKQEEKSKACVIS